MCTNERKGGLGIKSFSKMNKALLCKWSWWFANDRNSLWRKVICNKFGETNGGWQTCDLKGSYGTSLWKEIRKEWPIFFQNAVFSLRDGRRINFSKDVWRGEETLCSIYPSLFNLALNKEATVADMWDSGRGEGCWFPTFLRPLNDWEIEEVERFLQTLCDQNFNPSGDDMLLLNKVLKGESVRRGVFVFMRRGVSLEALRRKLFEPHNI